MERLRILAAAAALNEFTVSELVAYSGANENTVRNVLHRDRGSFGVVPKKPTSGTGRPPQHYRVLDVPRIRAEVGELERQVAALTGGVGEPRPSPAEDRVPDPAARDRLAAIVVAEQSLLRAAEAGSADVQLALADTARESLSQAEALRGQQKRPIVGDALDRRAGSVGVLVDLVQAQAEGAELDVDDLRRGAAAVVNVAEVAPPERLEVYVKCLAGIAWCSQGPVSGLPVLRRPQPSPAGVYAGAGPEPVEYEFELAADTGEGLKEAALPAYALPAYALTGYPVLPDDAISEYVIPSHATLGYANPAWAASIGADDDATFFDDLTAVERRFVALAVSGLTTAEIAAQLSLSARTVRMFLQRGLSKIRTSPPSYPRGRARAELALPVSSSGAGPEAVET
jgi:hypothetical protein